MLGIPFGMVVIVVKEFDRDGVVVVVEGCIGSEDGVGGGVGVWKGPCDKTELELELGDAEDVGNVVSDGNVSDGEVCFDDGLDSESGEEDDDDDVGSLYIWSVK